MTYVLLAVGGVIGALGRYHAARLVQARIGDAFPLGTLLINLSGSLALGALTGLGARHAPWLPRDASLLLGTGVCGSYTTFSSFGYETVQLWRQGRSGRACVNIAGQLVLGALAAWLGIVAGTLAG